jgi:hypothetical protein
MDTNPQTRHSMPVGAWCAAICVAGIAVLATACGSSTAAPPTSTAPTGASSVLTPAYAKSAGFPKTLSAAKKSAVTSERGCSSSVGAVYEDSGKQKALITSVLNCNSVASATTAFTTIKKHYGADAAVAVPKALGTSAFATASIAPQYLMVWQKGSKVAITAVDVNLAASKTTTSSTVASPPLTQADADTLGRAAEAQNALLP